MLFIFIMVMGCSSGLYPVEGSVTFADGSPLKKGMVILENEDRSVSSRGMIGEDGKFILSTNNPGDGMKPGTYRGLISTMDLSDVPDEQKKLPFHIKFTRFDTSNIILEIKPGKNVLSIQVTK